MDKSESKGDLHPLDEIEIAGRHRQRQAEHVKASFSRRREFHHADGVSKLLCSVDMCEELSPFDSEPCERNRSCVTRGYSKISGLRDCAVASAIYAHV